MNSSFENSIDNIYDYYYDSSGRLLEIEETLHDGVSFKKNINYGDFGQIDHEYYNSELGGLSSSLQIDYSYVLGTLTEISSPSKSIPLWRLNEIDERGNATDFVFGNGIGADIEFDEYGFPFKTRHSSGRFRVLDFEYSFNTSRGILESRSSFHNSWGEWKETFDHDNQNQLTKARQEIVGDNYTELENEYDSMARIARNEQVGDYNYNSGSSPYQLQSINLEEEAAEKYWAKHKQQISYNAFKSPERIIESFDIQDEDDIELIDFTYNAFNQRSARYYDGNSPDKYNRDVRKYYSGIAPIEIKQDVSSGENSIVYYIRGDAYQAPVAYEEKFIGNVSEEDRFLYLHRDYLGTIFTITADPVSGGGFGGGTGTIINNPIIVERRHFDAWGGLIMLQKEGETEAEFFDEASFDTELYLDRGYTGHEHMASVSLIHMNGRLYDAKLRRFLAPDNFIQDPYNTQNFNRYAYVYNNPLIYNDPSGEFLISAIIIVGSYGILSAVNGSLNPAKWDTASQVIFTVVVAVATAGALAGWDKVGALFTKAAWKKGGGIHNALLGKNLSAFKGNMVAGTLNFAYNYNGNVWNSLGYFAAGFFGSAIGTGTGLVWKGMVAGGALNVGATSLASDFEGSGTLYQMAQKFVGGALSSLAGMNLADIDEAQYFGKLIGKGKKSGKSSYLFGKKSKFLDKGFFYGLQSYASDFAYMDREKFEKRGWYNHFFSFSIGVFNGFIQADTYAGFWHSLIGYSLFDYGLKTINNGYDPYNYKDREIKTGIFSLKSIPLLF